VKRLNCECAFSLVEVTLALGIAGFALIAIVGLLPIGINSNQASIEQTAAAGVVRAIMADLRTTPAESSSSSSYQIVIPTAGTGMSATQQLLLREDGSLDIAAPRGASSRYLAYVTFNAPPAKAATSVRILVSWPAAGDLNNNPPKNFAGSYEVVSALDRN
jgi:uncharacterized protein (TIGR02598 family)